MAAVRVEVPVKVAPVVGRGRGDRLREGKLVNSLHRGLVFLTPILTENFQLTKSKTRRLRYSNSISIVTAG